MTGEMLATSIAYGGEGGGASIEVDGHPLTIAVERA